MEIPNQEYTPEIRELVVKRVRAGQSIHAVVKDVGLINQTLSRWTRLFFACLPACSDLSCVHNSALF